MRNSMRQNGVEPRVRQDDFDATPGRGISLENGPEVGPGCIKHG
jgi:hypothetical protein